MGIETSTGKYYAFPLTKIIINSLINLLIYTYKEGI